MKLFRQGIFIHKPVFDCCFEGDNGFLQKFRLQKERKGEFVAYQSDDGRVHIGWSLCHKNDRTKYHKEVGVQLALDMADTCWEDCHHFVNGRIFRKIPKKFEFDLLYFVFLCKKYYKVNALFPQWTEDLFNAQADIIELIENGEKP